MFKMSGIICNLPGIINIIDIHAFQLIFMALGKTLNPAASKWTFSKLHRKMGLFRDSNFLAVTFFKKLLSQAGVLSFLLPSN